MNTIAWNDFEKIELRAGTVKRVEDFPEARKPAYKIWVDFGQEVGTLKSSAQVTELYSKDELIDTQIVGVVNFPLKQIGPFMSEFLVTGFPQEDGAVALARPDKQVPDGSKLG